MGIPKTLGNRFSNKPCTSITSLAGGNSDSGMIYIIFGTAFALVSPLDIITPVLFCPTPAPTVWRNSTHKEIPISFLNMTVPFNVTARINWEYFDVLFGQSINQHWLFIFSISYISILQ